LVLEETEVGNLSGHGDAMQIQKLSNVNYLCEGMRLYDEITESIDHSPKYRIFATQLSAERRYFPDVESSKFLTTTRVALPPTPRARMSNRTQQYTFRQFSGLMTTTSVIEFGGYGNVFEVIIRLEIGRGIINNGNLDTCSTITELAKTVSK
jgi:hypothetical protein